MKDDLKDDLNDDLNDEQKRTSCKKKARDLSIAFCQFLFAIEFQVCCRETLLPELLDLEAMEEHCTAFPDGQVFRDEFWGTNSTGRTLW